MNVLVTGSSGLIGSALTAALTTGGHRVTRLVRSGADPAERRFAWDPAGGLCAIFRVDQPEVIL